MKIKILILIILLLSPLLMVEAADSDIIFTEIMYDLSGTDDKHEWVEIYNTTNTVINITDDWRFFDGSNHTLTIIQGGPSLAAKSTAIIADDAITFLSDHPGFNGQLFDSVVKLNNEGEEIKLSIDGGSNWLASVTYSAAQGANGDGKTLEFINNQWQVSNVLDGTPGQYGSSCNCDLGEGDIIIPPPPITTKVVINELCPDPEGSDEELEFIELYNGGAEAVNVSGWQLRDESNSAYSLQGSIPAGGYLVIYRSQSKISLNNTTPEKLYLYDQTNKLIDNITYEKAEKLSYSRQANNQWRWVGQITPGAINQEEEVIIPTTSLVVTTSSSDYYVGQKINFTVTNNSVEQNNFQYLWTWGDGQTSEGKNVQHQFTIAGTYPVRVQELSSSVQNQQEKFFNILIIDLPTNTECLSVAATQDNSKEVVEQQEWLSVAEVKDLTNNRNVVVKGVVATMPGLVSKKTFFLADISDMGEVDLTKTIPVYYGNQQIKIQVGDTLLITGQFNKTTTGVKVNIKKNEDIKKIDSQKIPTAVAMATGEIGEELLDGLVTVKGELVMKKGSNWFIDDGSGQLRLALASPANLKWPEAKIGDQISASGIVGQTKSGIRLTVFIASNIQIEKKDVVISNQVNDVRVPASQSNGLLDYFGYGLGAIGLGVLSVAAKLKMM